MSFASIEYSTHARQRMFERDVEVADVEGVLRSGEIIEDYSGTRRGAGYLVLGWSQGRPLHVVASDKSARQVTVVVILYGPRSESKEWTDDFRRRRR